MYNKGLHEILTTKLWDILPPAYHAYKEQMTANLTARIPLVMEPEKTQRQCFYKVGSDNAAGFLEKVYAGNPEYITWRNDLDPEDRIVNVIFVNGPITGGGGACSYGSKELRDRLIDASNMEQVIGHVICIDSPGGSSMAKYDFEQAIDYVHEKGQKVIAFIDGQACSAGYAVAAMCDEIYFMHPANDVGCIGTMCAFSLSRHGDENAITKETYIELYAEGSPYKNREFREAAEGNYDTLMGELNASAEDFKNMVRKNRPQVTDEQLLGDTYSAGQVVGSLVDRQGTFQDCVERIIALANGDGEGTVKNEDDDDDDENGKGNSPEPPAEPEDPTEPSVNGSELSTETESAETNELNDNKTPKQMNKEYLKIREAVNNPALQSDKNDALYLTAEMCETLENSLAESQQKDDTLGAKIKEIELLNSSIETLKAEHAEELKSLKEAHETALKEAEAQKSEVEKQVADLNEKLSQSKTDLEAKEAELQELSQTVSAAPKPAEAPVVNTTVVTEKNDFNRVCHPGMTAAERREALAAQMDKCRRAQND